MDGDGDRNKRAIGRRIREARESARLSQEELAKRLKVKQPTVSAWEAGGSSPKRPRMKEIADITGFPLEWLELGSGNHAVAQAESRITVIGAVQAGIWREALEWPKNEQYTVPVLLDPRYPHAERFGLEVRGDSMDQLYIEKSVIVCVRFDPLKDELPIGKRVVVTKRSREGLVEATVKELRRGPDGSLWLVPLSHNPRYSPQRLDDPDEENGLEIHSVVVGHFTFE